MILEKLSNAFGPSGCETEVRKLIRDEIASNVTDLATDHLGNLTAVQKGSRPDAQEFRVMVTAHMDEIGFMITHADGDGFLHFTTVGGVAGPVMSAKRVVIGEKKVKGVICSKPVHMTSPDERGKTPSADGLVIDIGASSKDDALGKCPKGTYAVFDTEYRSHGSDCVAGKAFDDRIGCALIIDCLNEGPFPYDILPVFTTMEEIGGRGAVVAAYRLEPSAAIALEGTVCDDGPTEEDEDVSPTTELGKGPALTVADRSLVASKPLLNLMMARADACGIAYQFKQPGVGGTDGGLIHKSRTGVPTAVLSVPSRYIHGPVSVAHTGDYANALKLLVETLKRIEPGMFRREARTG
jgi:endoglucanase